MKVFYIVQNEMLTGGVIEAQVIGTLRAHSRIVGQPRTKLIFLEPARVAVSSRARVTRKRYQEFWPEGDIQIVPYVSRFGRSSPGKSLSLYLARERLSSESIVFHCRGPHATWSANVATQALGRGRVIFDVRGPLADETIHRLGSPWLENLTSDVEESHRKCMEADKQATAVADHVFTVSPGLKRYAVEKFGANARSVTVVPSCVENLCFDESTRDRVRKEWGVSSRAPVFLYSGRLGRERLPAHMFRIFGAVLQKRPDAKLVLMTYLNQLSDLEGMMSAAGVPASAVIVVNYSRDEALRHMSGADVGMLFLEPALRYKDCGPIKFPEYLSAGLSVTINSAVGQLPELVRRKRLGWVIDHDTDQTQLLSSVDNIITQLEEGSNDARDRSLETCSNMFLWRNHISAIRAAYGLDEYARKQHELEVAAIGDVCW